MPTTSKTLRVFVLADTHNRLPTNLAALASDADQIWHLGDVCDESVLATIETFGPPVAVVRGNCDSCVDWPLSLSIKLNGVRFCLTHIPPPSAPENSDVVLHGHTHVPRDEQVGSVRFLNPGCVTRPNRGAPPSVAMLEVSATGTVDWRTIFLR